MHELSIAENIIKIVSSSYKGEKENIKSIIVNVGELTGIQPESLVYIFNLIKNEYRLINTELKVNLIRCKLICEDCGSVNENYRLDVKEKCPSCGSDELSIIGGNELVLLSIETFD